MVIAQNSAAVVLIECIAADSAVWQSRLEARALSDRNVSRQHKPKSWADLQALIKRYGHSKDIVLESFDLSVCKVEHFKFCQCDFPHCHWSTSKTVCL